MEKITRGINFVWICGRSVLNREKASLGWNHVSKDLKEEMGDNHMDIQRKRIVCKENSNET